MDNLLPGTYNRKALPSQAGTGRLQFAKVVLSSSHGRGRVTLIPSTVAERSHSANHPVQPFRSLVERNTTMVSLTGFLSKFRENRSNRN